jgi:hypothetical protein
MTHSVHPHRPHRSRLLDDLDDDDPMLSLVNLIDVFLVIIAALLLVLGRQPLNLLASEQLTVIKNAGKPDMEVLVKNGRELTRFQAAGKQGEGRGVKAGMLYRMGDGGMVYVPE